MKNLSLRVAWFAGVRGGPQPSRDWHAMLGVAVVLLAAATAWGLWVFNTVIHGGAVGALTPSTVSPEMRIRPADTVRSLSDARAAEAANFSGGVYLYTDPSR